MSERDIEFALQYRGYARRQGEGFNLWAKETARFLAMLQRLHAELRREQ